MQDAPTTQDSEHMCQLYREAGEQKAALLPFLKSGLDGGECCVLLASESQGRPADEWLFELQAAGVDVRAALDTGALVVVSNDPPRDLRQANPIVMAREAWTFLEEKLAEFPAIRVGGDNVWSLDAAELVEKLAHWEATYDLLVEGVQVTTLCQYDLSRQPPPAIHAALLTHRLVMLDGATYANPYFEASRILAEEPTLDGSQADAVDVEEMFRRLKATTALRPPACS